MIGNNLSRKDDLESLFYTLINLFQVSLKKLVPKDHLEYIKEKVPVGLENSIQQIITYYYLKLGIKSELI